MNNKLQIENFTQLLESWNNRDNNSGKNRELAISLFKMADELLFSTYASVQDSEIWHRYLNLTGHTDFLTSLPDKGHRYQWAETAARAIAHSQYSLLDMFRHRVKSFPDKTLFRDMSGQEVTNWSYQITDQRTKSLAAGLLKINKLPRVAIVSNNCVESAFSDLACLFYNIPVTPLNVHFDANTIAYIFDELEINIVLTDSAEHRDKLQDVQKKVNNNFIIYAILPEAEQNGQVANIFRDVCLKLSAGETKSLIEEHPRNKLNQVNTVMFTSGSTGLPKGISFSEYNLVTKRFARAAALPEVGNEEILLCYLPLYHTFGRYFELLGTIYWSGTYIFPGNPSTETLLSLLSSLSPTGLISVPIRWQQIQERCLEKMELVSSASKKNEEIRKVIGSGLRWGLSAAGYLAPTVFKFFNNNGVKLCSGFGMTEATGGITMTPPNDYQDNSIGIPLPLTNTRLTAEGELEISGAYIARYLTDKRPGDEIPITFGGEDQYWLATGDLFMVLPDGHMRIVDRLKDIYKNSKGQTIAPQQVEKKFDGVPGAKRAFLVGDAREYNVLLIVPDNDDPVIQGFSSENDKREYFHQIISNANKDLAAYERVVNFAILDRDFSIDNDELTPKGSLKRKNIEHNFEEIIKELYRSKYIELKLGKLKIRLPRWFYRDLGILEDTIQISGKGLLNIQDNIPLEIRETETENNIQIGDLVYDINGNVIDLGLLARQPSLWIGNPSLIEFCPCKEGWDAASGNFTERVFLPSLSESKENHPSREKIHILPDNTLSAINSQIVNSLFGETDHAMRAINQLAREIKDTDERIAGVIRKRLVALANHPEFKIRSLAYRTLLLDEPSLDYGKTLPAFIESGLPFLDDQSIAAIASSDLSMRRLLDLRRRLFNYRTRMNWPVSDTIRRQFVHILHLLADFAKFHPQYYDTVRCELASWILHKADSQLSKAAEDYLDQVIKHYEMNLSIQTPTYKKDEWESKFIFGDELTEDEKNKLKEVLMQTTFLKQSVLLAFDQDNFELDHVNPENIWVSRITSRRQYLRYRVSINTKFGKHFDLQIIIDDDVKYASVMETLYWLLAISSHPYGSKVLPRLGCCRPELGARSLVYLGQLTMWEKIREYSERRRNSSSVADQASWRKLYIRGLTAIFRGWKISGKRIIPGAISPENLVVPFQDFIEGATILSLTGWRHYDKPISLIGPIVKQFYQKTTAHYPWCRSLININWMFDACIEELGLDEGRTFLNSLLADLDENPISYNKTLLKSILEKYLEKLQKELYLPLPLCNAINRYHQWAELSGQATAEAREQIIHELLRLYRLDRYPEIIRYYLYSKTYFSDAGESTKTAFTRLLERMYSHPERSAMQLIELSELQATLDDAADRNLFSKIIFPKASEAKQLEVVAVGESERKQVMVKTVITDKYGEKYYIAEPKQPAEIGQLYRLFFKEGYPKTVTERDQFLLVFDSQDQIVGGLCYRYDGEDIVHLDGSIIAPASIGNGIGSALLEDFCTRMTEQGVRLVKTHFFLRKFYTKRGFQVDSRWGALVRFLDNSNGAEH
ncbi:MAG: GNAT family N-acetyltransferase [Candidatus Zixiibacteriota bacterium]